MSRRKNQTNNAETANVETPKLSLEAIAPSAETEVAPIETAEEKREYNRKTPAQRINKLYGDLKELTEKCYSNTTEDLFRHIRAAMEDLKLAEISADGLEIVAKVEARRAPDPEKDTGAIVEWNDKRWKIAAFRKERKGYTLDLVLQDPALPAGFEMKMSAAMSQVSLMS